MQYFCLLKFHEIILNYFFLIFAKNLVKFFEQFELLLWVVFDKFPGKSNFCAVDVKWQFKRDDPHFLI